MTNFTVQNVEKPHQFGGGDSVQQINVVAFGNALLDLSVETNDNYVLKKYQLNEDDQCEIPGDKLVEIVKDATIRYGNIKYNPGGSALNTCRILKGLGEENILFFGAIGNDENGEILKSILEDLSLDEGLQVIDGQNTGTCICLINETKRSLCANIGASLNFQKEYLLKVDNATQFSNVKPDQEHSQIYYIEGYFIPNKFDVCRMIYEFYCEDTNNLLAINLNAQYVCENFPEEVKYLVNRADLVFSNFWELSALTTVCKFKSNEETVEHFLKQYSKKGRSKTIIITKGDEDVQVFRGSMYDRHHETYPVEKISRVIDTTGAGDSFVGGFLYAQLQDKPLAECVRYGCEIAAKVITQIGCNLPPPSSLTSSASSEDL